MMQGNVDAAESRVTQRSSSGLAMWTPMLKIDLAMRNQTLSKAQAMVEKMVADHPQCLGAPHAHQAFLSTDRADKAGSDIDRILAELPNMPLARYFKAIQLARHNDLKAPGTWPTACPGLSRGRSGRGGQCRQHSGVAGYPDSGASILNVVVQHFPWLLEARLQLVDLSCAR